MSVALSKILTSLNEFVIRSYITDDLEISQWKILKANQTKFSNNCLYIGKASSLNSIPTSAKINLLLIEDDNVADFQLKESLTNILLVHEHVEIGIISEKIQTIFMDQQRLGDCTIKILSACQQGSTVQQLLDLGFELLKNPLLLVDLSLCFVAQSGGDTIKNEPLWEWTLSEGYVTEEYVQSVMSPEIQYIAEKIDHLPITFWNNTLMKHRQLVGRVVHDNKPIAYLKLLEVNEPITSSDENILEMLCKFLAITMNDPNRSQNASNNLIDSFLIALLNQKIYDHDAIEERKHLFGLKLYENLFVITIQLNSLPNVDDRLYYLKRIVQSYFNRQTILIYNGQIVVLFDSTLKDFSEDNLSQLDHLLLKNNCTAGISQVFYNLHEFSEYYKQSIACLHLGGLLHKEDRILQYNDYIFPHMILHFHGETNIKNLIHPAVITLKKIDEEKGTDFLKTLLGYISHNQNITMTSKTLHIHYNTVKYRIKRIEELTKIDFSDSETLLRISFSSKVLEVMEAYNFIPY